MSAPPLLGRLRRVRRLGAGGFATVWLYHDPDLDSPVAVKLLAENWAADPAVRERFLAESRLLRRVSSPHLVPVYDVGVTQDDTPYFVMAYADRGSVADLVNAPRLPPPEEVVRIVEQAAAGLAVLHAAGIVHRDVKPANLIFVSEPDDSARLMVADLGVAKALGPDADVTQQVGSPSYMAPEQVAGLAIDARADVRALGAVAYALFAGRPPLVRSPGDPPTPLPGDAAVPRGVDQVIMRALEPDPSQRWSSVTTFAEALRAGLEGSVLPPEPSAPPVPRVRPTPTAWSRGRWLVAASVILALGLVAAAAILYALRSGSKDQNAKTTNAYVVAARQFLRALRAGNCAAAAPYLNKPSSWNCRAAKSGDFDFRATAEAIDPTARTRVEALGKAEYRVVFVDEGYVLVKRRANSTIAVIGLVSS